MLNLLLAITTGSALFLAFLVCTLRGNTNVIANRWLAAFVLMLGCLLLDSCLASFGIYQQIPSLSGIFDVVLFALAPTLYLGVAHFVSVDKQLKKQEFWHFLPFLIFFLLNVPFLLASDAVKTNILESQNQAFDSISMTIMGLALLQILVYWGLSMRKLLKHRRNIEQVTAATGEFSLNWLRWLLYSIVALALFWMLDLGLFGLTSQATLATPGYLILIWWLGYFALQQKEVYPFSEQEALEIGAVMAENEHPLNSRKLLLAVETIEPLKNRLLEKMDAEKPYLDSDLNLSGLSKQMGLSVHEMSELVNEGFGENFARFVNRYRVEESKRLLLSTKHGHLNMVGIAFEAGFNSKTAFNTTFKKITGVSPSEFRSQVDISNSN